MLYKPLRTALDSVSSTQLKNGGMLLGEEWAETRGNTSVASATTSEKEEMFSVACNRLELLGKTQANEFLDSHSGTPEASARRAL